MWVTWANTLFIVQGVSTEGVQCNSDVVRLGSQLSCAVNSRNVVYVGTDVDPKQFTQGPHQEQRGMAELIRTATSAKWQNPGESNPYLAGVRVG